MFLSNWFGTSLQNNIGIFNYLLLIFTVKIIRWEFCMEPNLTVTIKGCEWSYICDLPVTFVSLRTCGQWREFQVMKGNRQLTGNCWPKRTLSRNRTFNWLWLECRWVYQCHSPSGLTILLPLSSYTVTREEVASIAAIWAIWDSIARESSNCNLSAESLFLSNPMDVHPTVLIYFCAIVQSP